MGLNAYISYVGSPVPAAATSITVNKNFTDNATSSDVFIKSILKPSLAFSSHGIVFRDIVYEDRLVEIPSITKPMPEFLAGIEFPSEVQVSLSNLDRAITMLRRQSSLRAKSVKISELYVSGQEEELNVVYRGFINSTSVSVSEATLDLIPHSIDIFNSDFPNEKITVDKFPDAIDLDFPIPYIIGTAKKIPLALVRAFEDISGSQYQYLVGRGDLEVDVVYRDDLVIKEFSGTAQGGSSNTIILSATDIKNDDFYNDAFILITSGTGVGQVRKIIDYVSSTKTATVDTAWTTTPNGTSTYVIREWKKILFTINEIIYTGIEFAIAQRDRDRLFDRERVSADVTGLQSERNPAIAIKSILTLFSVPLDVSAFAAAAARINTIGGLFVDGAVVEQKKLLDILSEICLIGRIHLRLSDSGVIEPIVIGTQDAINGKFSSDSNIVEISGLKETSLDNLFSSISLKYRRQFSGNEYRLTSAKRTVKVEGRKDEVLPFDFIFDKTTADKVTDWLAKIKAILDNSLAITLGHEARKVHNLDLIDLDIPELSLLGFYQIIGIRKSGITHEFDVIPYDESVFSYTPGALPSDPVTDARADFSKTPPDAVTGLALTWTLVESSYTATANLNWTNPTENFKEVLIEYKKSTDTLYNTFTTTIGTSTEIAGLIPGLNYDFRLTSINQFDLHGGIAQLLTQLAPGDSTAPATPTGLVGPTTTEQQINSITWKWDANPEPDIKEYRVRVWTAASGGTKKAAASVPESELPQFTYTLDTHNYATTTTLYAEVAAKDFSGNKSAFTTRVAGSTKGIGQGDIITQEVQKVVSASNTGTTTTSPIISLTFPGATNRPIWIEFSGFMKGSAGLILSIGVNSTIVYSDVASGAFGPSPITAKARVATPGTGNLLVEIFAGNIPPEGISNRNLVVYEAKNA